jgi:uncharacterized protein (TIGR02231 family)
MRKGIFFLWCYFFCMVGIGEAAVTPEVNTVDFYPTGARFVFRIPAFEGERRDFEFTLPGAFDSQSVRLLTQDGVTSMRAEAVTVKLTPPKELDPLKKVAAEKQRELRLWRARQNAVNQALYMLHSMLSPDVDGKEFFSYVDKVREERLRYETELVDLELGMEKAAEELKAAEEELNALRSELERKRPRNETQVVSVSGTAITADPILFEAYTSAAGWNVRYDMNLDSGTGVITAKMQARAWQQTGLNLKGEFFFHSRHPSPSIDPPEVSPMPVGLLVRPRSGQGYPGAPGMGSLKRTSAADDLDLEAIPPAPTAPTPSMTATLTNVSVKGTGSLKSDGTPEDVMLGRFELTSTPLLSAIPERIREAWIVASLDAIPMPLLPGAADLAVDGMGSGRISIPAFGLQDTLSFGMAPRVTATKERLIGKSGTSWFGKGVFEDGYTLEIVSNMETEREVTVKDRIPLPVDERVQLEIKGINPAPVERDKDNKLTWKLSLKPGETRKIVVEYSLRYPSDEVLDYRSYENSKLK